MSEGDGAGRWKDALCSRGALRYSQRKPGEGAAHAGPRSPLLLLNSRASTSFQLLPHLDPSVHVVIAEIPGLGDSSPPWNDCTMEQVGDMMNELLGQLRIPACDVFGLHTGHKVGAALALRHQSCVRRLLVCGKTHSLIPGMPQRNQAMRDHLVRYPTQGLHLEEPGRRRAYDAIFAANFAFDFGAAVQALTMPVRVLEITSDEEDRAWGRSGVPLRALNASLEVVEVPMTHGSDALYIGAASLAMQIEAFLGTPRPVDTK